MTKRDSTYQNNKVTMPQNADTLSFDSDGYMDFFGYAMTGQQLYKRLYKSLKVLKIGQGATSDVFSTINMPSAYRYIILSMTSNLVQGSFWLTSSPSVGDEVYLLLRSGSVASGSVVVSASGVSIVGQLGTAITLFHLMNSSNSAAMAHLVCLSDGEWSIVDTKGGYAE